MSNRLPANAPVAGNAPASEDLGPLAWVIGEVQKSIETASKSPRRQAREGHAGQELESGPLRMARQQLHHLGGGHGARPGDRGLLVDMRRDRLGLDADRPQGREPRRRRGGEVQTHGV